MIIIRVIMHHYTRGGHFHRVQSGGEESSSSVEASPQSSLSLAVGSLESHYLWIIIIILIIINLHHSAAAYPPIATQLRINIVSVLIIIIPFFQLYIK